MPESKHRRRRGQGSPRGARSSVSQPIYRPRKRKTNKLYLVASAVIAILVIASFALGGLGGGGNRDAIAGGAKEYVEGVGVQQELMPTGSDGLGLHVPDSQSVVYNTVPPTSGDHWRTPARCGFYPDGTPDEQIVHNLEHGNIVVSYNLTDPAQIDQLTEVVDGIGFADLWGITRFYDQIPEGQVALTTWGVLDIMEGVDRDRIRAFFDYAGNLGPEIGPC